MGTIKFLDDIQMVMFIALLVVMAGIIFILDQFKPVKQSLNKVENNQEKDRMFYSEEVSDMAKDCQMESKFIQEKVDELRNKQEEAKGLLQEMNLHIQEVQQCFSEERQRQEMDRRDATMAQNSVEQTIPQVWQEMKKLQAENSQLREEKQQLHEKMLDLQADLEQYQQKNQRPSGYDGPSMER